MVHDRDMAVQSKKARQNDLPYGSYPIGRFSGKLELYPGNPTPQSRWWKPISGTQHGSFKVTMEVSTGGIGEWGFSRIHLRLNFQKI